MSTVEWEEIIRGMPEPKQRGWFWHRHQEGPLSSAHTAFLFSHRSERTVLFDADTSGASTRVPVEPLAQLVAAFANQVYLHDISDRVHRLEKGLQGVRGQLASVLERVRPSALPLTESPTAPETPLEFIARQDLERDLQRVSDLAIELLGLEIQITYRVRRTRETGQLQLVVEIRHSGEVAPGDRQQFWSRYTREVAPRTQQLITVLPLPK